VTKFHTHWAAMTLLRHKLHDQIDRLLPDKPWIKISMGVDQSSSPSNVAHTLARVRAAAWSVLIASKQGEDASWL
jgi:hypothetical protein